MNIYNIAPVIDCNLPALANQSILIFHEDIYRKSPTPQQSNVLKAFDKSIKMLIGVLPMSRSCVILSIIIIIIIAEMAVFNVAGYLIEERRRWPVITASPRGQHSK